MQIPAVCSCGLIFPSGFGFGGNVQRITLRGNKSQCPKCGNMASVPDMVFSSYNGVIEILESSNYTHQEMKSLFDSLKRFYHGVAESQTNNELHDEIEKAEILIPFLARFLPDLNNKAELYTFIALLLQALSMLMGEGEKQDIINFNAPVYIQQVEPKPAQPSVMNLNYVVPADSTATGMCQCGSGLVKVLCCSKQNKYRAF